MVSLKPFLLAVALATPWVSAGATDSTSVKLRAVRFYNAGTGLTQVRAFIQIPLESLVPTGDPDGMISYHVGIHLRDSTGALLSQDAWPQQHLSADLREPGVTTVNSLDFVVRPGHYRLEVTVQDSVSGNLLVAATDLTGFQDPPPASDLVLSPGMRAAGGDSAAAGTEWRNGPLLVTSAAELVLTPLRSKAFYLLEAYTERPDSGSMQVQILDAQSAVIVQSPPVPVRIGAGGGILRGQLDLEGLPPGQYRMKVVVHLSGQEIERTGGFRMLDAAPVLARRAAEVAWLAMTDSGYFGSMDETALNQAFEPLSYIAEGRELRAFDGASLGAKRRFLTDFWSRRDPDSTTVRNELREQFYGMIAYADSAFRERGANTQSGWKTDRGRVYIRYGAPDEVLDRVRSGRAPSYLVWHYTRGKGAWYIFSDRSGLGAYKLLHSNDLREPGLPDWKEILGPEALRDVGQFLAVDFFDGRS